MPTILNGLIHSEAFIISPDVLKRFHRMVGKDIGETFHAVPGVFRSTNVVVGNYRPPARELVEAYVAQFCDWLKSYFHYVQGQDFDDAVIQAIVSHGYIAWIHPFSDGNGRTARLPEFYLLVRAGVPDIASHIVSTHYNETRAQYYQQLQDATLTGDVTGFLAYALEGFRDGLEGVLHIIHEDQVDLTWNNYVHDILDELWEQEHKKRNALKRVRQLAYHIPSRNFSSIQEIKTFPRIFSYYKDLIDLTLQRDLEILERNGIVAKEKGRYRTRKEIL